MISLYYIYTIHFNNTIFPFYMNWGEVGEVGDKTDQIKIK